MRQQTTIQDSARIAMMQVVHGSMRISTTVDLRIVFRAMQRMRPPTIILVNARIVMILAVTGRMLILATVDLLIVFRAMLEKLR
jgi:hypothetical protein